MMKAVIDLGSNMAQMLIIDNKFKLTHYQDFTALGEKTFLTSLLTPDAIDRTLKVLLKFKDILFTYGIPLAQVKVYGTQACRMAKNTDVLFLHISKLGFYPKILSEEQEAYFGALACLSNLTMSLDENISFDIGGASTEIAMLENKGGLDQKNYFLKSYRSYKIGILEVNSWLNEKSLEANFTMLKLKFLDISMPYQNKNLICTRGTMTSLFNLAFDHRGDQENIFDSLLIETDEMICRLNNIKNLTTEELLDRYTYIKPRISTLTAAIEIFLFFCELLNPKKIQLSDKALSYGALINS